MLKPSHSTCGRQPAEHAGHPGQQCGQAQHQERRVEGVAAAQPGDRRGEAALPQPGSDRIGPVDARGACQGDGHNQESEEKLGVHGGLQGVRHLVVGTGKTLGKIAP